MKEELQEEPDKVEFNHDVHEPFSFHYRGGLPCVFSLKEQNYRSRIHTLELWESRSKVTAEFY
jgi:hypothetical protein